MSLRKTISLIVTTLLLGMPCVAANSKPNRDLTWGSYTIHNVRLPDEIVKAQILDGNRRAVKTIVGRYSSSAKLLPRGRGQSPLLVVSAPDGGNNGLDMVYLYVYDNAGVQNVGYFRGTVNNLHVCDYDKDGFNELDLDDYASLQEFDHFSRGGVGFVKRVYRWDGKHYLDATALFWTRPVQQAGVATKQAMNALVAAEKYAASKWVDGHDDSMASSHEDVLGPFVDYWANMRVCGGDEVAKANLRKRCSGRLYKLLTKLDLPLRVALRPLNLELPIADAKIVGVTGQP